MNKGNVEQRTTNHGDWKKIGTIVKHIVWNDEDCDITAYLFVNLDSDSKNSFIFVQRGHDCSRFGWIFYKCKNDKRIEFDTYIPASECRNKFGQKIRLKNVKLGNGEGISQYSLQQAGMSVAHIKAPYDFDTVELAKQMELKNHSERVKAQLAFNKKRELELAERKRMENKKTVVVNTSQLKTISTAQKSVVKQYPFAVFISNGGADRLLLNKDIERNKRYVLVDRCRFVAV
jgi:hypothetical protein